MTEALTSYHVRVRGTRTYRGKKGTTYTVRWTVQGREWQKTFPSAKLAEGYRSQLFGAASAGAAFIVATGLPASMSPKTLEVTWLDHAIDFVRIKWPDAAPKYRKSLAESLTVITTATMTNRPNAPSTTDIRRALFGWVFARPHQAEDPPQDLIAADSWLRDNSPSLSAMADPSNARELLESISYTLDGRRASSSTIAKRRSALHNCFAYAVERKHIRSNPLDEIQRKRLPPVPALDRRRVANPVQARAMLESVRDLDPTLHGFFAAIYYAGLRPAEAVNLRLTDCVLPDEGWGEILLCSSYQRPGRSWTDDGGPSEERQLKHRAKQDTRRVPAHPNLVRILRSHAEEFQLGPDGCLFVSRVGRGALTKQPPLVDPVSMRTVYRIWQRARESALTDHEFETSLARRPYDLRHACLSTWLNAGVAPTQVAEWAGHSVPVLLTVYAKCLDGQEAKTMQQIESVLEDHD